MRDLIDWKLLFVGCAIVMFFLAERIFPAVQQTHGTMRLIKNYAIAAINFVLSPLIVLPLAALASDWALQWRPQWYFGWTGLALDIVLLDIWIYWWHRANHVVPTLWRFHEIHHLDETLDTSSAVRFHFGEVLLSSVVRAVVITIAAVPLTSVIIFETLVLLSALFHHSNLRLSPDLETLLSRLIVTPSIHWVHHHAKREDTDSNYATVFAVWDTVFASRSATSRSSDMAIGVEGLRDRPLIKLLLRPLQKKR
jgi:sterol desaturase/sphingolipid hydroxylase (fatty acid hydroxylase superfamily)